MRSLAQPKVLVRAVIVSGISSLASWPRLAAWLNPRLPAPALALMLFWCLFVLWAFVIAWQPEYTHRPVLGSRFRPGIWIAATICGALFAVLYFFLIDPRSRQYSPQDFPADPRAWLAMGLFNLAFNPLFLCFAPFAFFIRLLRRETASIALTVMFGMFILYLKLTSYPALPSAGFVAELVALRAVGGFLTVYFYLQGGAFLVWWLALLMQLRLLPALLMTH